MSTGSDEAALTTVAMECGSTVWSRVALSEQGLLRPSDAECLKVTAEESFLVLGVLGIGKNLFLL